MHHSAGIFRFSFVVVHCGNPEIDHNRGALAAVFDGVAAAITIVNKDNFENRTVSPSALDDSVFHEHRVFPLSLFLLCSFLIEGFPFATEGVQLVNEALEMKFVGELGFV
jgi:hypothetical protein